MSERPEDDTTEPNAPSQKEREPQRGSYYYDDATGYELYDPAQDDEEQGETEENEPQP
jgi:hypothetical protein